MIRTEGRECCLLSFEELDTSDLNDAKIRFVKNVFPYSSGQYLCYPAD